MRRMAEDLKTTLVTSDKQIRTAFPKLTTSLKTYAGIAQPE